MKFDRSIRLVIIVIFEKRKQMIEKNGAEQHDRRYDARNDQRKLSWRIQSSPIYPPTISTSYNCSSRTIFAQLCERGREPRRRNKKKNLVAMQDNRELCKRIVDLGIRYLPFCYSDGILSYFLCHAQRKIYVCSTAYNTYLQQFFIHGHSEKSY